MKRIIGLATVLILTMSLLVACSTQPASTPNSEATLSPESTGEVSPATDDTSAAAPEVALPEGGNVEAVAQLPDKPLRLAFLSFQNNPFWLQIKDGALLAQKYLANFDTTVDYIVIGDELTTDNVIAGIENAIAMDYNGIAVCTVFDGTEVVVDKAVDAGIPVITYVAESTNPGKRFATVGQDAYAAGQIAGQEIEKYTGGSGKIGVITGVFGAVQHEGRMNGALDYLAEKCPDIEVIGKVENNDQAQTAYNQTMDMLTAYPDLKLVYVTAGGPFGAAQAIQEKNLTGQVGIVCYDHTPENLEYVYSGEIVAAVSQDPIGQGFDSLVMLYNYIVDGTKYPDFNPVNNIVVTPGTVEEMYGPKK